MGHKAPYGRKDKPSRDSDGEPSKGTKKDVLAEINLLAQNDFWNGNDLLYFFCEEYPIPTAQEVEEQRKRSNDPELLTPAEARFADQMWLIGRAYAASPERYSYSKGKSKGKPKETFLHREGYESYFQDIARILLREECRNGSATYFRGKKLALKDGLDNLSNNKRIIGALVEILNMRSEEKTKTKPDVQAIPNIAKYIDAISTKIDEVKQQLRCFDEPLLLLRVLSNSTGREFFETNDKNSWSHIKMISDCVIYFAKALNAARIMRDVAIVVHTLMSLDIEEFKKKGKRREEPKKGKLREWVSFSEGTGLLIEGVSSVSISFSSKFLHFHYPKLFFIYDAISADNAPKLHNLFLGYKSESVSSFRSKSEDSLNEEGDDLSEKEKDKFRKYYEHAARELDFAYFIIRQLGNSTDKRHNDLLKVLQDDEPQAIRNVSPIPHHTYITRLVDELVMNGNTDHQVENESSGS